jgi:hypothetical protein
MELGGRGGGLRRIAQRKIAPPFLNGFERARTRRYALAMPTEIFYCVP